MSQPLLTVIIVSWKVRELLGECLKSVFSQTRLPVHSLRVIVVDNASHDGTVEMLRERFPQVEVVASNENLGFGRANALAFTRTESRYVLLLNPDTVVFEGGIDRLLERMETAPDIIALGCRLCNGDGSLQRWTGGRFPSLGSVSAHYLMPAKLLKLFGRPSSVYLAQDIMTDIDVDWLTGACLLLRRNSVPLPLFDESYWMYGEDIDLCHRIWAAGGRVVYTPSVTVMHYQGASMRQQSGDVLLTSLRGMRQFYARQAGPIRTRLFDIVTVCGFGLRWLLYKCAALVQRDTGYAARAASSAHHAKVAIKLMRT